MAVDIATLSLPALSPEGMKVLEMVEAPDAEVGPVSEAVAHDPLLSSTLLSIANSPAYRRRTELTNARHAVSMLGLKKVRMAVMVVAMRQSRQQGGAILEGLWEHAFAMAALMRRIAGRGPSTLADDLEFTGLMHDMGALVLAANYPDAYRTLFQEAAAEEADILAAERAVFGVDRSTVLAGMGERLHLPGIILEAEAAFRAGADVGSAEGEVETHHAVLALAHHLDRMAHAGSQRPREPVGPKAETLRRALNLGAEDIDDLVDEFESLLDESLSI
ncbi:MAG: HDOD domain-containing protein [Pseudomonadota bacterium]